MNAFSSSNTIPVLNNGPTSFLYIALPVINEAEFLHKVLACIRRQDHTGFHVFVCVNQPDEWWEVAEKRAVCEANTKLLHVLENFRDFGLTVIDRCTRGNGWTGKKHGVGWARKTLMDAINKVADEKDIIISLDADTTFSDHYFSSLVDNFSAHPDAVAMAVPYYHERPDDDAACRAMLRYEIYMRHYSLNLWRIGNPYSFTALGSAMACPVWAYRAVGGMTPKMSGEDFYFLQKLRKYGKMIFSNSEKVYPAARFSDRVYFGTGPAMIKGNQGDWKSYPFYSFRYFDEIRMTTERFREFYAATGSTPVVEFLKQLLKEEDPFQLLRVNFRDPASFARACHEKFDGLRILQYLKSRQGADEKSDEENMVEFLARLFPEDVVNVIREPATFTFAASSLDDLDRLRNFLVKKEEEYQVSSVPSLPGQLLPGV
jgi:glycosyltransferase involved in cell wall biosynthesis